MSDEKETESRRCPRAPAQPCSAADGVFVRDEHGVRFVPTGPPDRAMLERIVHRARKRMLRWLGRHGYLEDTPRPTDAVPDGIEACRQTALHYGELVGLPSPATTKEDERFEPRAMSTHRDHARTDDGFDLDAHVRIEPGDDVGRERLVRYCARPAVVLGCIFVFASRAQSRRAPRCRCPPTPSSSPAFCAHRSC